MLGMRNAKPAASPMESGFNNMLWRDPDNSYELANNVSIDSKSGVMFLIICTRPGIAFAVCGLALFCEQPTNSH